MQCLVLTILETVFWCIVSFLESEVSDVIVFAIQLHNSVITHESILMILL